MVSVTLGNIVFDGGKAIENDHFGWYFTELSDWMSLTSSKAEMTERPLAHGAFDPGMDWRNSGVYTLTALYRGQSVNTLEDAIHHLTALGGRDDLVTCTVDTGGLITSRRVQISQVTVPSHHVTPVLRGIQVDLKSPDPFAYAQEVSATTGLAKKGTGLKFPLVFPLDFGHAGADGRVRFTNSGTAPVAVRMSVNGGMSEGFQLKRVETSDLITVKRTITATDVVDIDCADGSVILNNASSISGFVTNDDFWLVNAGETCTVQFTAIGDISGTPSLKMTAAPAYY